MELDFSSSVCRCWQIIRQDQKRVSFTDHDRDIEFGGDLFSASSSMNMSAIEKNVGLEVDNFEISGFFDHEKITKADIESGLYDEAEIICFEFDWAKKEVKRNVFQGCFSSHSYSENSFSVEAHSQFSKLNRVYGRGYHRSCDAELGDERCGLNLKKLGYVYAPKIVAFEDFTLTTSNITNVPAGNLIGGIVEFYKDAQLIKKSLIRNDVMCGSLRKIDFWTRLDSFALNCDNVKVTTGCDKSIQCCNDRFNNAVNFRGFPYIPNDDWITVANAD